MTQLDLIVLFLFLAGFFVVGGLLGRLISNTDEMFAAGRRSPWWMSGLSAFMTMFSAGTFVVWGGIAYKWGMVAVAINMCYGLAALLAGRFVASRWRRLGITTPAEYIRVRFGRPAVQFYTWSMMIYRITGVGVSLYSLSVLVIALIPLSEGNPFRDPATGNLALLWGVLLFGSVVIIYTMMGGLWAVLVTDAMQFIVLTSAVLLIVPLLLSQGGGIAASLAALPEGFLHPTTSEFTWLFLAGWCTIHFFMIGAEWAFVQRFLCVPSDRDARRSTYLFGILYLVSPLLWMLPPMLYRVIDPNANPEEAYILACRSVLPAGLMGLVMAAMFSATASMVSSQLNVFAGVLTSDFYRDLLRPGTSEATLVRVGRLMTVLLGVVLIVIALAVPRLGGAEEVILTITSLLVVPLLAPSIWGLFSRRIDQRSIWLTALPCFALGSLLKFGLSRDGWFAGTDRLQPLIEWLASNSRSLEVLVSVVLPVLLLTLWERRGRGEAAGWRRIVALSATAPREVPAAAPARSQLSMLPVLILAWCLGLCGALIGLLALLDARHWRLQTGLAICMIAIAVLIGRTVRRRSHVLISHHKIDAHITGEQPADPSDDEPIGIHQPQTQHIDSI